MRTYKATIPSLCRYNSICVIREGREARAGTESAVIRRVRWWLSGGG
ncbi:type I restriction endonuclease subunit R, partial [Francisella tularensis subsp. holarctica]|nr:type I restriction endonuclease subunit R [Francisella tularensis subsp. holarctica]